MAAGALWKLAYNNHTKKAAVVEAGALRQLVELLTQRRLGQR
jgi:hypothetical protein